MNISIYLKGIEPIEEGSPNFSESTAAAAINIAEKSSSHSTQSENEAFQFQFMPSNASKKESSVVRKFC